VKILHVIDTLAPGGAERICLTTANLFATRGYEVTVLELLSHGPLGVYLDARINRTKLDRKSKFSILKVISLSKALRESDVVHVHMRHVYRFVFLANLIVKRKLILHDHFNSFARDTWAKVSYHSLLRNNLYVSVNEQGKEWALSFLDLKENQVFKITNVIIPSRKVETGKSNKFILVSNIKREKFIEFIVPLTLELNKRDPSTRIDLVGKVMDKNYLHEIVAELKAKGVLHCVSFINDIDLVQNILGQYTMGLHFSKMESGPLVLLEYLAQDLIFVAYRTGEISEKINKSLPSFFMSNHDAVLWCDRIYQLINHKIDSIELSKAFNENNNIDEYFNQWLTVYKRSLYL
jgi:glycosyltransferase involved in cell wall biosynthesis